MAAFAKKMITFYLFHVALFALVTDFVEGFGSGINQFNDIQRTTSRGSNNAFFHIPIDKKRGFHSSKNEDAFSLKLMPSFSPFRQRTQTQPLSLSSMPRMTALPLSSSSQNLSYLASVKSSIGTSRKTGRSTSSLSAVSATDSADHSEHRENRGGTNTAENINNESQKSKKSSTSSTSSTSSKRKHSENTLTPNQILHPDIYYKPNPFLEEDFLDHEQSLPLFAALQQIIRAVEQILHDSNASIASTASNASTASTYTSQGATGNGGNNSILNYLDPNTSILRIEQSISEVHAVDPLCWLHAQQGGIRKLRKSHKLGELGELGELGKLRKWNSNAHHSKSNDAEDGAVPVIYFGDAEGHLEAAMIGKASHKAYSDSWDPFGGRRIWDSDSGDSGMSDSVNGIVNGERERLHSNGDHRPGSKSGDVLGNEFIFKEKDLPLGSRVYGGSRFDWQFYREKMQRRSGQRMRKSSKGNRMDREGMGEDTDGRDVGYDGDGSADDSDETDDWDGFGGNGGGYWVLPAVELRREVVVPDEVSEGSTTKDTEEASNSGEKGGRKVTLAVHLHNLSSLSSSSLSSVVDPQSRHQQQQQHHSSRHKHHRQGWYDAAIQTLTILRELSDQLSPAVPCTTLPPVLTRLESTGRGEKKGGRESITDENAFERGVTEALAKIGESKNGNASGNDASNPSSLRKVVLARKVDLNLGSSVNGLDVLMRMKFGGHIGHIFYLNPGQDSGEGDVGAFSQLDFGETDNERIRNREFLGCTPERLFQVKGGRERIVTSEALAGTRIRGLTHSADAELLRELLSSKKDMLENEITGQFIRNALDKLEENGWLEKSNGNDSESIQFNSFDKGQGDRTSGESSGSHHQGRFFVRRLRHLQHICQTFEGRMSKNANVIDVSRSLLQSLHPTPAVCGDSASAALDFIRTFETRASFDRGFYAGPFGYIGRDSVDIVVAIRSALVTNYNGRRSNFGPHIKSTDSKMGNTLPESKISVFAGAGIVEGSTVQGEWTETSHKMGVLSSLFPPSPITLQSYSMPNVAWTTAFIEELVRCGVTQFYICPGSRNTPLTAAIYKSTRSNVGVVRAISVHDERGAGFRALGYARQNGRPAVVVTSSGTAVANLYPSVVESSSDGVPLILLTADRPYENRDTGSNQSVDQVKVFSSSYVRWFRDIPPPSDDVPVSLALSDANHAVTLSKQLMGPVHLNVQFRENLAPDGGSIRNDDRIGSMTNFHAMRFTDVAGFLRWCRGGNRWLDSFYPSSNDHSSAAEIAHLIQQSRRGVIVTGNLRSSEHNGNGSDYLASIISHFAQVLGWPVLAGVQSGALRREYPVIPYAEHLLKNPLIANGIKPDFILQLGTPLISTEASKMIKEAKRNNAHHVMVQHLYPYERADPDMTVTHRVSSDIGIFLQTLLGYIDGPTTGSELAPLIYLGRELQKEMPSIIQDVSYGGGGSDSLHATTSPDGIKPSAMPGDSSLIEPQIMVAISEVLSELSSEEITPMSLFLSNSMPVRDGEFFLYPTHNYPIKANAFPLSVSVNRGASGIDGIISTATGCGDTFRPTTLVAGDVTTLHDLNALYGLTPDFPSNNEHSLSTLNRLPLTTIVVNNGGGAIFSFLPIAKHGQDVGFEEFWGTPTRSLSFEKCAAAFGLPFQSAASIDDLKDAYRASILLGGPALIEAKVVGRSANVDVHKQISSRTTEVIDKILSSSSSDMFRERIRLPIKQWNGEHDLSTTNFSEEPKTLLLLHGWMGDKSEWNSVAEALSVELAGWNIVAVDLPGHGDTRMLFSSDNQIVRASLGLDEVQPFSNVRDSPFSLDEMARSICESLIYDHGITHLDGIAGYSLGGRVALAMKRLCSASLDIQDGFSSIKNSVDDGPASMLVTDQTKMVLFGSHPGKLPSEEENNDVKSDRERVQKDYLLAKSLFSSSYRAYLSPKGQDMEFLNLFLKKWYGNALLWGDLERRDENTYQRMLSKRIKNLKKRRQDIAQVLYASSPPHTSQDDWKSIVPKKTLFVAGELDKKYSALGQKLEQMRGIAKYVEIANAGHALIDEAPQTISLVLCNFVKNDNIADEQVLTNESLTFSKAPPPLQEESVDFGRKQASTSSYQIGIMEYEAFSIVLGSNDGSEKGILGIGWGDSARAGNEVKRREGFIVSISSNNGMAVGVGEVSPLKGLHKETLEEAENQLSLIQTFLSTASINEQPSFHPEEVLSLDGSLSKFVDSILSSAGIEKHSSASSVRSGLEMAVLSIAAQINGHPLPKSMADHYWYRENSSTAVRSSSFGLLPISGLITREESEEVVSTASMNGIKRILFRSLKVKVGHKESNRDIHSLVSLKSKSIAENLVLRADANRAWDFDSALHFVQAIKGADDSLLNMIEFVEEPLEKQMINGQWNFRAQVSALEAFTREGGLGFALDESLFDLAEMHDFDINKISADLRSAFAQDRSGCAAFVLKPALLGLEISMQIARIAQQEFQISAVFSSSFDSGIGLAYMAMLAAVADMSPFAANLVNYSHGLGTFTMLCGDTLSPAFESYVNEKGMLNVASLSRALYGLSLDEISDRLPVYEALLPVNKSTISPTESDSYLATTSASTSGRDISVSVTLPLPFSDSIASSRFTDLPQMSRWSPWINSVIYLDTAGLTEWNVNIRGVKFSWKAKSEVLLNPKGIRWESISGLKNRGQVDFEPTSNDSCLMKLKMSIIMPYILVSLFQGMPSVVHEFLQNKLLKWSLEMFRDVVKADLALERGDVELGDALFGAVEGRANALEEALK